MVFWEEACEALEDLLDKKHFPLIGLVELKYLNHCEKDKPEFLDENEDITIPENFHKNLSLKTYYELSKNFILPLNKSF